MADMFRARFWMLVAVVGLTLGPLLATAGYGLYLRSGLHCRVVARHASRFLNAPVQIGGFMPLDHSRQGFRDVAVWLPGEFNPIFTCRMAVLQAADSASTELELRDARIEARTDDWDSGTLARLLATVFAHDFQRIRLRAVRLINLDLAVQRGKVRLWDSGASGRVDLSGPAGRMDLICKGVNGVPAAEPIRIRCDFEPGDKPLIRELSVSVPRLGIEGFLASGIEHRASGDRVSGVGFRVSVADEGKSRANEPASLFSGESPAGQGQPGTTPDAAGNIPSQDRLTTPQGQPGAGWFTGKIIYRQASRDSLAGPIEMSGELADIDLAAIGRALGLGNLDGLVHCTLDGAVLNDGQVQSIQGRLRAERLELAGLLALAGLPAAEGSVTLNVQEVRYEAGSVQSLLADAEIRDLEVEPLLALLQVGTITGRLSAQIQGVRIAAGRLEELAGAVQMAPPTGADGTIDRSILETAVQRFWKISLPPILPEKVPYAAFGARFHSEDGDLHIDGVAGPDEQFVFVAQVDSAPVPLLPSLPVPLPLGKLQARMEAQIRRLYAAVTDGAPAVEPQRLDIAP